MSTPALLLPPDQANYAGDFGNQVVDVKLEGGASRFRADEQGAVFIVNCRWQCDATNFNYLTAFYRTAVNFGALPFNIDLLLDNNTMNNYVAHFVPGTFGLDSNSGETYVMKAQLEVCPNPAYYVNDAAIIAAGPD
jgi:hypothetical protein